MKRCVQGSIVLALLAFCAIACIVCVAVVIAVAGSFSMVGFTHTLSGGKSIDVAIYHGTDRIDRHLPALNGSTGGFSGGYGMAMPGYQTHVQFDEKYKILVNPPGNFQVVMHRAVEKNNSKTVWDITLPVWKNEPTADKRIKLGDDSAVVAYLTTDSTH